MFGRSKPVCFHETLTLYPQKPRGSYFKDIFTWLRWQSQGKAITSFIFQMLLIVLVAIMQALLCAKHQSKLFIPQQPCQVDYYYSKLTNEKLRLKIFINLPKVIGTNEEICFSKFNPCFLPSCITLPPERQDFLLKNKIFFQTVVFKYFKVVYFSFQKISLTCSRSNVYSSNSVVILYHYTLKNSLGG